MTNFNFQNKKSEKDIKRLSLRPDGMFSNVNEVVQQLYLAELGDYQFLIDWSKSCYRDENMAGDTWEYYFKPCFPGINASELNIANLPKLIGGGPIACSRDNIITPRIYEGQCRPLLLPRDRSIGCKIIEKYISISSDVAQKVDKFREKNFSTNIIGLHIRGAGKLDGGVAEFTGQGKSNCKIPFNDYFQFVDRIFEENQESKIFVCSDSNFAINEVIRKYGEKVITYDATRSEFGEMHANHAMNRGLSFSKYKLGLDVVVEAYLLSKVNFLVHGTSNVVNFVLCKNPGLKNYFIYESQIRAYYDIDLKQSRRFSARFRQFRKFVDKVFF